MASIAEKIILYLTKHPPASVEDVNVAKRKILKTEKTASMPDASELIKAYHNLRDKNKIKDNPALLNLLTKRSVRTLSGVAVVTVLTKPFPCPGECVYCPNEKNMPKSYISDEPAAARALALGFDPFEQVARRLETLRDNGHPTDKVELIVKGGSWNAYPLDYQYWFIGRCFEAANYLPLTKRETKRELPRSPQTTANSPYPLLERGGLERFRLNILRQQTKNETAKRRIIGLTLETRPDAINEENIKIMRELGCTRVELGAQTVDDKILKLVKRGHNAEEIKRATKLLKNHGFKVDYHLMPQLPGSTPKKDLSMMLEIFENPDYRPDMIKIYPCTTVEGTKLFDWLKKGKYKPYTTRALINLLKIFKTKIPRYARVSRLIRDIPSQHIKAGNTVTNLRQVIQKEMAEEGTKCRCLRCREVGHQTSIKYQVLSIKPRLFVERYTASDGVEYFLSFEDKKRECVFAFCRLRITHCHAEFISASSPQSTARQVKILKRVQDDSFLYPAFIRELHTYGQLAPLQQLNNEIPTLRCYNRSPELASGRGSGSRACLGTLKHGQVQHTGLGRKLMDEVEKICKKNKIDRLAVISGVGVRGYYRKLGYKLENGYMVKKLTTNN